MPIVKVRNCPVAGEDISLCYDDFGDQAAPALLLIHGIQTDMKASFTDDFCNAVAKAGPFRIIRFDLRDCGESTLIKMAGPAIPRLIIPEWMSVGEKLPYKLPDHALDAFALMDYLKIDAAHVAGRAVGGRIGLIMAASNPSRVLSLSLINCSTGGKDLPKAADGLRKKMMAGPKSEKRDDVIAHRVELLMIMGAGTPAMDDDFAKSISISLYDRSQTNLAFNTRPIAAAIRTEPHEEDIKSGKIRCPVFILHGGKDPIVPQPHGDRLAKLLPDAKYVLKPELAHHIAPSMYEEIAAEIAANARRSD